MHFSICFQASWWCNFAPSRGGIYFLNSVIWVDLDPQNTTELTPYTFWGLALRSLQLLLSSSWNSLHHLKKSNLASGGGEQHMEDNWGSPANSRHQPADICVRLPISSQISRRPQWMNDPPHEQQNCPANPKLPIRDSWDRRNDWLSVLSRWLIPGRDPKYLFENLTLYFSSICFNVYIG